MAMRLGLIAPLTVILGGVSYFCTKTALDFAADLTERSLEFCKPTRLQPLSKEDKCRLPSCKPLKTVIGGTFTVTKRSVLTISQDVILGNVINLLVGY